MKKFKGITLVELLVAMAVFSIIMVGVMNMIQPVQQTATETKILNYQKTNEETVITYIGEQLRYANNILIAEQGAEYDLDDGTEITYNGGQKLSGKGNKIQSPKDAVIAFNIGMGISTQYKKADKTPEIIKPTNAKCGQFYHVLIWDGKNEIKVDDTTGATYKGRLYAAYNAADNDVGWAVDGTAANKAKSLFNVNNTNFEQAVKDNALYPVFGKGYFGPSDMYLQMNIDGNGDLFLKCTSDYYPSAGQRNRRDNTRSDANPNKSKFNSSDNNPTVGTYELRNYRTEDYNKTTGKIVYTNKSYNNNIRFLSRKSTTAKTGIKATRTGTSEDVGNIFYIVYTTDEDLDNIMNYGYRGDSTEIADRKWGYHDYDFSINSLPKARYNVDISTHDEHKNQLKDKKYQDASEEWVIST